MEIRCDTIREAWPKILSRIINFGDIVDIKVDGKVTPTLELPEPLMVILGKPEMDMIAERGIWTNKEALEIYSNDVINNRDTGHDYTYGERLKKFKDFKYYENINSGRYIYYDQIQYIISRLIADKTSRQAIASTWKVEDDMESEHPPCLLVLDYIIRKNKLLSTTYIRSNDMFGAWPENAYMLVRVGQYINQELYRNGKVYRLCHNKDNSGSDVPQLGNLSIISNKSHIYYFNIEEACKIANMPESADNILEEMGINTRRVKGIA